MALISNCCGALNRSNGDNDFAEFGICPDCGEHCEFEEEENDPEIELKQDNWGQPGNTEYLTHLKNMVK